MEIVVRATVIYFFLWLVIRGMGKRELAEMSPFELIMLVTMGDLVQQGVTQEDFSLTGAFIAVGTIAVWVVVFSMVSYRWTGARRVLDGVPIVVVRDGVPLEKLMRRERVNLDDIKEAAREQGIGNLRDVRLAVLEPDGKFAFIKNNGDEPRRNEKHLA